MIQLSDFLKYQNNGITFFKGSILVFKNSIVYGNTKKKKFTAFISPVARKPVSKPKARV